LRQQHKQECTKQIEADMEEAFATQRSQDKQCGICMEIVWEKDKTDQCFGVLENCNHVFCLACIRKWRQSKTYENKIVKYDDNHNF
jgi:E3 ubiquitin-protein ligase makorin